jgi:radical SAM superfamily enzyme YgiQ (UPF0313 family)
MHLLLVEIAPADQRNTRLTTGLGYIAAYLRRSLPQIEIQIIKGDPIWVERYVRDYRPDMVGLSTVSQYYPMAMDAADVCKQHGSFVVLGGHHVSALPDSMPPQIDLGIIGEGEETMLEICQTFLDKGPDRSAFAEIAGVAILDGNDVVLGGVRSLHRPLDDFPVPARDLMHIQPGESVGMITSRGCPYRCVFCASSAFWESVRFHSAEYVVAEAKEIVERYHTQHIYLWDDLFVADSSRVEEIARLLQREPKLRNVKFSSTCRANLVTEDLAIPLKEMNISEVMIGFESMAPRTLQYLKPHVTVDDNRQAVEILNRHGIKITGFFVIGSPKETPEEIEKTLDFVRTAPLYRAEAYLLTPLPGTQVWQYALERGLIDPDNVPWGRLYIDNPTDPQNAIHLSETMSSEKLYYYWREFQRIRRCKDYLNLVRRIPQHLRFFLSSPFKELEIIIKRLRTHSHSHI